MFDIMIDLGLLAHAPTTAQEWAVLVGTAMMVVGHLGRGLANHRHPKAADAALAVVGAGALPVVAAIGWALAHQ